VYDVSLMYDIRPTEVCYLIVSSSTETRAHDCPVHDPQNVLALEASEASSGLQLNSILLTKG